MQSQISIWEYKIAQFDADFESVEQVGKKLLPKN
jgi:hypothetical protein